MLSARVGAMPQPSQQDSHQGRSSNSRGGRKKGITMEDLKKQTALRLAQEQQKGRMMAGLPQSQEHGHLHHQMNPQSQYLGSSTYGRSSNEQILPHFDGARIYREVVPTVGGQGLMPMAGNQRISVDLETQTAGRNSLDGYNQQKRYPRSSSVSSVGSSSVKSGSSQLDSSSAHKQSTSKSKLPHGLTVQELKEMTKARLQAEAAEQSDTDTHGRGSSRFPPTQQQHQQFPLIREHHARVQEPGTRDVSGQFIQNSRGHFEPVNGHVSPAMGGHQRPPLDSQPARQQQNVPSFSNGSGQQISSAPPGFSSPPMMARNHDTAVRESWQQPRLETWDNTSVASLNSAVGSEYMGSDSAYTPQQTEDLGDVAFTRSRTYPVTAVAEKQSFDLGAPPFSSGSSFAEHQAGWVPNRRRASTLSPRPGLTQLYEDRPLLSGGQQRMRMPLFDPNNRSAHPAQSGMLLHSPHDLSSIEVQERDRSLRTGISSEDFFNRPRTASAPTIPSFVVEEDRFESELGNGAGDDLPNSVVESVLGLSDRSTYRNDIDAVFRSSPSLQGNFVPSLDNFGGTGGQQVHSGTQVSISGGHTDWSSLAARGPFPKQNTVEEDALADGLGSVLKLSGIDSVTNESNLVSRLDPEVSMFTRSSLDLMRGGETPVGSTEYRSGSKDISGEML